MKNSKRPRLIFSAVLALIVGAGLAQAAAIPASAAVCQGYVNKAGTNVPYTAPPANWTRGDGFGCSTTSGIGTLGHKGQDYWLTTNNPVAAVATGTVVERGWEYTKADGVKACHGKYIVVEDAQGVYSIYAHLDDITAAFTVNSTITRGQQIGITGTTGSASDCKVDHIGDHVEIMIAYTWTVSTWGAGFEAASTKYTNPVTYMANH